MIEVAKQETESDAELMIAFRTLDHRQQLLVLDKMNFDDVALEFTKATGIELNSYKKTDKAQAHFLKSTQ